MIVKETDQHNAGELNQQVDSKDLDDVYQNNLVKKDEVVQVSKFEFESL